MLDPSHQFCFSFALRKITLIDDSPSQWQNYQRFRIQIHRHQHFVSSTPDILCIPNQRSQLILSEKNVTFTLHHPDQSVKQTGEVRLYEISKKDSAKLIGCYEFLLNNYVKAYHELNRNCIQVRVHIAENYVIEYDVFVEKNEEALQRLIQQHETAKKFHMDGDDISEIDSFLPHEITNENLQEIYREIKIDQASPVLIHQRFWSPKRERHNGASNEANKDNEKMEKSSSTVISQHTRLSLLKMHKTLSTSDYALSFSKKQLKQFDIQSQPETEDRFKTIQKLYRVIQSDSKIIQPGELQEHQKSRIMEHRPLNFVPECQKTLKKIANGSLTIKYIVVLALLITTVAFFISIFQASAYPGYGGKGLRKIKNKH